MNAGIESVAAPPTQRPLDLQPLPGRVEMELLFHSARTAIDAECRRHLEALLDQNPDWDALLACAHRHRVLPLVCRSLERVAPDAVPDAAMHSLRSAVHANARRTLRLTGELLRVIALLRAHDIPCLPYKGPVLAARVYGDLSLRQFGDLDILVAHRDVDAAARLLVADGYRSVHEISTEKDLRLRRDELDLDLELHWGVTTGADPIQLPRELLWSDLSTFSIGGTSLLAHPTETLLLVQCVHGAKHAWERLVWLCDVAEIVRSEPDLDWHRAIDQATALGARRILLLAVALARDLLGAEPPADVTRTLRADPAVPALSDRVKTWLSSGRAMPVGEREPFFVSLRERSADRLRITFKQARAAFMLTARDTEVFPVPPWLNWTLYPLRIVRLVREYGMAPFGRILGGLFQK